MIRLKPFRSSFFLTLTYKRPMLDWQGLPSRFFKFIFETMTPQYLVSTSQLSVNNPNVLSELEVKYNIFGGASTLTMNTDKMEFAFPIVVESDRELISDILRRIHDSLPITFPECDYESVELRDILHADIANDDAEGITKFPISVADYLERYKVPGTEKSYAGLGEFEQFSSGRLETKALDKSWYCRIAVERSLLSPNGIFLDLLVKLEGNKMPETYVAKQEQVQLLRLATLGTLGLAV